MKYPEQLKAILKSSGWTQEELARHLGVSFATLNSWVNCRSKPRKNALEAISILYFQILGTDDLDIRHLEELLDKVEDLTIRTTQITKNKEILDKLILYLTYNTNVIEGSTMTLNDTRAVLFENKNLTNRSQLEQAEARNHRAALLWLLSELQNKNFKIDGELIKALHLRLMNGIIEDAGLYRNHSVRISGTRVTVANYLKVSELVRELSTNINTTIDRRDVVKTISVTHAAFEKIHPFSDGNGRVGRLLMLAQALKANLVPPLVLKERRRAYYKYLELAQIHENSMPLQLFVAESMITTMDLLFNQ